MHSCAVLWSYQVTFSKQGAGKADLNPVPVSEILSALCPGQDCCLVWHSTATAPGGFPDKSNLMCVP